MNAPLCACAKIGADCNFSETAFPAAARRGYVKPVSRTLALGGGTMLAGSKVIGTLPDIDPDDDPWNSRGASASYSPGSSKGFGSYTFGESPW